MIKRKKKLCIQCREQRYIFSKRMCLFCYQKNTPKKPLIKEKKKIRVFSKKRLAGLKEYRIAREQYLKENPLCMFPGCNSTEVTLHHSCGRIGAFLTDKRYFKSLCWPHHQHIEQNPVLARKLGLSYSRLTQL